jgi:hypothetical protein
VAEQFAQILKGAGFAPTVSHRDLNSRPIDSLEQQGNQGGPIYND